MTYRKQSKRKKLRLHRILIVCEGKTERFYLEGLKRTLPRTIQRDIEINILTAKEGEPQKAISEITKRLTIAKRERQPYKESWLVFDDDNRNLEKTFKLLRNNEISFAYSSIALEFWFLLHFKKTTRKFPDADTVIDELEGDLGRYSKTDTEIWSKLASNYLIAKSNAIALRKQHKIDGNTLANSKPYTNMDELVDKIKNLII